MKSPKHQFLYCLRWVDLDGAQRDSWFGARLSAENELRALARRNIATDLRVLRFHAPDYKALSHLSPKAITLFTLRM